MAVEAWLRRIAGFFVVRSVAPGNRLDARFDLLAALVGVNLFQSAFSGWCPTMAVLGRLGVAG